MKTKRKTTAIISVVIAAVLVVSLSFLFVGSSFAYDKIADDINENHDSMSDEEFIEYSTKLSAVVEKISPDKLTSDIMDKQNSEPFRTALLDVCEGKKVELDKDDIKKLVEDKSEDKKVRSYALSYLYTMDIGADYLEKIAESENSSISAAALSDLFIVDSERACAIADNVLSNFSGNVAELEDQAVLVKSLQYRENASEKDVNALIDKVKEMISGLDLTTEDGKYKADELLCSLAEIGNKNAISFVINNDLATEETKLVAVCNNIDYFKKLLSSNVTNEDAELVYQAVKVTAQSDLLSSVKSASQNSENSAETRKTLSEAASYLEENKDK